MNLTASEPRPPKWGQTTRRLNHHSFWYGILIALTIMSLSGCGFQLRGESKLHTSFSQLAVKGRDGQVFRQILIEKLEKSGVTLSDSAEWTIHLLGEDSEKRVSAYSTRAKSAGFELRRVVTFKVIGPGQKSDQIEPTTFSSRRHLLFREDQIIGKLGEEDLLWQEMNQELADRIIYKLEAIQTQPANTGKPL
ncbi:Probable rare lipoprotein B [gamma proteobacterium HdN1]|nr:Probable rare lipoprotein B [gamma proteobacterium HdN1]